MKLKKECCDKVSRKGKACKRCPLLAALSKKQLKKLLREKQS
jgi:hypothetical protein